MSTIFKKTVGRGIWYFHNSSVLELTEPTVSLGQKASMRYMVWLSDLHSTGSILFAEEKKNDIVYRKWCLATLEVISLLLIHTKLNSLPVCHGNYLLINLLPYLYESLLTGVIWLVRNGIETSLHSLMGRHEACSHAGGKENIIPIFGIQIQM